MNLRQLDVNAKNDYNRKRGEFKKRRRAQPEKKHARKSRSRSRDRAPRDETTQRQEKGKRQKTRKTPDVGASKSEENPSVWEFDVDKKKTKENRAMYMGDYSGSIMKNLWAFKEEMLVDDYFPRQRDLREDMRTVLFTWLVEVHQKFECTESVLWHTFDIIDRFLTRQTVKRSKLQLVGCTAFFIATKYGEIFPPQPTELVNVSDRAFSERDLLSMETNMLEALDFDITRPTMYTYLTRFISIACNCIDKAPRLKDRVKFLAHYAMERYVLDRHCLSQNNAEIAAVVMYTAMNLTSNKWGDEMISASGLTNIREQSNPLYQVYHAIKRNILKFDSREHKSVITKYSSMERGGVSKLRKKRPGQ